jgi:hypothetical protein
LLLGAVYGKEAIPAQWSEKVLTCRPEAGNPLVRHPRPECFWPVDVLHIASPGEQKSLTTDRVTLVLGPPHELEIVREMFSMASHGLGPTAIADELNRRGETHYGHPWYHWTVRHIVTNPKYMGSNVWGRTYQRLQTPKVYVEPQHWINKPLVFPPIVDQTTFMRAQRRLPVLRYWTKEKIVKKVGELLKRKGRISEDIIRAVKGMPAPSTITLHLGSYQQLYKELNYRQDTKIS